LLWLSILLGGTSCVNDSTFDAPKLSCEDEVVANIDIAQLTDLYNGETLQIFEDLVIEGYVTSSDIAGNFFNVLHFQDTPINPTIGLQIELELRDSHLFFQKGQHIYIKLKGLYLGKSKGVFKIGGVFSSFGNRSVGRLPKTVVFEHILSACDAIQTIAPLPTSITALNADMVHTSISIDNIEFGSEELGQPFAEPEEETKRILVDCEDNELVLLNSGYSDFQSQIVPNGSGRITGVLLQENNEFQLVISDLEDINFNQVRCEDIVTEFTSNNILITEIADPDNNTGARFVEIYNSSEVALNLNGWQLIRYTNANTEPSSSIDLNGNVIEARGFLIISPNATEFTTVYGFSPDIGAGTNSPADSNGDDNLVLQDPFGQIIDIFGVIGEDGTGTYHEFENGRAVRNLDVLQGNSIFTSSEWSIYNDTGNAGTINLPQNAPEDFTPGIR
ncbi:MAG: DUF5689 domain-containing protein, partial [Maribacter sp.]